MSGEIGRYYRDYYFYYVLDEGLPLLFDMIIRPSLNNGDVSINIDKLKTLGNKNSVITVEEVNSWFSDFRFKITSLEAQKLTDDLNLMRVTEPVNALPPLLPIKNILNLFRKLHDKLPKAIQNIEGKIQNISHITNSAEEEYYQQHIRFLEHVKKIQGEIDQLKNERSLFIIKDLWPWHSDAVAIVLRILGFGMSRKIKISYKQVNSQLIKITKRALERAGVGTKSESAIVQALLRFPTKEEMEERYRYQPDEPTLK